MSNQTVSIVKAVFLTMVYEAGLAIAYYVVMPIFFKFQDAAAASVTPFDATAAAQMDTIYWTLRYGFPSLLAFAMIAGVAALWIYARRIYYASGTVWSQ